MLAAHKPFSLYLGACLLGSLLAGVVDYQNAIASISLALLILLAGLPHGAYDLVILRNLFAGRVLLLSGLYALTALLVIVLWQAAPGLLLAGFLLYSAIHFGDSDWPASKLLHQVSWGAALLATPALTDAATLLYWFSVLTHVSAAQMLVTGLSVIALPVIGLAVFMAPNRQLLITLLAAYTVLSLTAGALVAFTVYFALLHSRNHLAVWRGRLAHPGNVEIALLTGAVLLAVLWVTAEALGFGFSTTPLAQDLMQTQDTLVKHTFVTLAALTVPHMVLVSYGNRRFNRQHTATT